MKRVLWYLTFAVVVAAVLVGWQSLRATADPSPSRHMKQGHMGMPMQTADSKAVKKHLDKAKAAAARKGMYMCCIKPSCEWCMVHMGNCTCHEGVVKGMGNCRECHGGWEAGQGSVPGVTRDDVRKMKVEAM